MSILDEICEAEDHRCEKPWRHEDGIVASDGRAILFVHKAEGDFDAPPKGMTERFHETLHSVFASCGVRIQAAALHAIAGEFVPDSVRKCSECDGTGESACFECGQDCECGTCGGEGQEVVSAEMRCFTFRGVVFDANRLAKFLRAVTTGDSVIVSNAKDRLRIDGDDWTIIQMAVDDSAYTGSRDYPVLEEPHP